MTRFPAREAEIKALAQNIAAGLAANAAMYPAPPVTPVALQAKLTPLITLGDEAVAARAVASYKIERRLCHSGDWTIVGVATESEATLNNQERNKDWEYRVIAVNKAGDGVPSNTVAAVV